MKAEQKDAKSEPKRKNIYKTLKKKRKV